MQQELDVPSKDVISHDDVSVRVSAIIYFRVIDPEKSTIQVAAFMMATSQLAQTTLRSVLGKHCLDEMLSERDKLNEDIQKILDIQTDTWGIKVANVEIMEIKPITLERLVSIAPGLAVTITTAIPNSPAKYYPTRGPLAPSRRLTLTSAISV